MRFLFSKDSRYSALLHIWGNRKVCAHKSFSPPSPPFFGAIELGTWVEVVPLLQVRPTLKPLDFDKTIMMTYWIKIQLIVRFKYIQETLRNDLIAAQELFCYKGH